MSTVTKKDMVKKLAAIKGTSQVAAAKDWDQTCQLILDELVAGNNVKLKGVGTLRKVEREAYVARIPNSDDTTNVPARYGFKLKSKRYDA